MKKVKPTHIRIWKFEDAPEELRWLSINGGDEDWLALVPPNLVDEYIPWMEQGTPFGCFAVDWLDHPELPEYKVVIGSHS